MTIELRPAVDADRPFLFELYAGTREAELSQVPWPVEQKLAFLEMQFEAQRNHYAATSPNATHEIMIVNGQPAGRLYLDRRADEFHILDITVAPAFRNTGVGSEVLRRVLEEADGAGKAVGIYTETFNPSTRLFGRLGFLPETVDGFLVLLKRPSGGNPVQPAG
jgi:RimJ/RimL family protein N-acetyltransferase